ncbi:hypothetical protein DBZ36_11695 [Alginatibacterium sediminis]|uniref:HTH iclR-type domain-containing protein n=1 Tax=Alginatibacterium sediminis TaxID=2164068 RepID=A0A420EB49_9ALTE|nr:hypothetical protein [Alginatibacterium sediminis]RKF17908.1 hypothetical protein DBZ36_11695 [Alginatibacterium sediminis]
MSSQPNQSLIDGIRCFQELTTSETALGNKELAEKLNINVVKVNRLLRTLKSVGMAEQNAQKKYLPGPAVHLLAAQSFHSSALLKAATHVALNTNYDDRTLAVGVLWNDSVVYMYHAVAGQSPAEGLGGFNIFDVYNSSIGQVLLAQCDDDEIVRRISHWDEERKTTIKQRIRDIRENGFVHLYDENGLIYNVATVFSIAGAKAGIAFTDLSIEEDELLNYVSQLNELVARIENFSQISHKDIDHG